MVAGEGGEQPEGSGGTERFEGAERPERSVGAEPPERSVGAERYERPGGRITAVDAARGIALLGMMAVHVMPSDRADGSLSVVFEVFSGRSAAFFAVLAGVGLALAAGGPHPLTGTALRPVRWGIAARAGVIAAIGLSLGSLYATVAVILAYYGVLFLAALPVLAWSTRRLAALAAVCALGTPVVSQLLRFVVPGGAGENVQWADLAHPGYLLGSVLLSGYYPALTWTTYLFAGLAVGRLDLRAPRTAWGLLATGTVLAAAGLGTDLLARSLAGGMSGLAAKLTSTPEDLTHQLGTSMFGTTPTDSWWWLVLAGRHSGSGPDLVHTTGTALAVLGCCLLVVPRLGRAAPLAVPLVATGSMTLTLYTLHVLALAGLGTGGGPGQLPSGLVLTAHAVGAVLLALLAGTPRQRGPLEAVAADAARRARELSRRGRPGAAGDGPRSGATPPW